MRNSDFLPEPRAVNNVPERPRPIDGSLKSSEVQEEIALTSIVTTESLGRWLHPSPLAVRLAAASRSRRGIGLGFRISTCAWYAC